jgi:hypothetical protein
MNSDNLKIQVGSKKYVGSQDENIRVNSPLETHYRELIQGDRTVDVALSQRFYYERQSTSIYRIYGKFYSLVNNTYSGTSDPDQTSLFQELYYNTDPIPASPWPGFPQIREFALVRDDLDELYADKTNWNVHVSYPDSCAPDEPMAYQIDTDNDLVGDSTLHFLASDGIPFHTENVTVEGKDLIRFHCGAPHGLNEGEFVEINFHGAYTFTTNMAPQIPVYSIGSAAYRSDKNVFNISVSQAFTSSPPPNDTLGTFVRMITPGTPKSRSQYYVVWHKILTMVDDCVINRCGFEDQVFKTQQKVEQIVPNEYTKCRVSVKNAYPAYIYSFTRDIDVAELRDVQLQPLTKLYVTVNLRNKKGYFDYPHNYGWSWNFPDTYLDTTVNSGYDPAPVPNNVNVPFTQYTATPFIGGDPLVIGDRLRGEFVEYNITELKEREISKIYHKFNWNQNAFAINLANNNISDPHNQMKRGYTYSPHYEVPIRVFSSYIEEGDPENISKDVNTHIDKDSIPGYATYFTREGLWKWRDLYDIGFLEDGTLGVDYPYMNGAHYPKTDIRFYVKRQVGQEAYEMTTLIGDNPLEEFTQDDCQ